MLGEIKGKSFIHSCIANSAYQLVATLLDKEINFSILCYINNVNFNPPIPENAEVSLKSITLFSLSGYTFTTVDLTQDKMTFEAGFGEQNFASEVTVPLEDILQILIAEHVIFVNPFSDGLTRFDKEQQGEDDLANSMQAILSNPRNKNLIKK